MMIEHLAWHYSRKRSNAQRFNCPSAEHLSYSIAIKILIEFIKRNWQCAFYRTVQCIIGTVTSYRDSHTNLSCYKAAGTSDGWNRTCTVHNIFPGPTIAEAILCTRTRALVFRITIPVPSIRFFTFVFIYSSCIQASPWKSQSLISFLCFPSEMWWWTMYLSLIYPYLALAHLSDCSLFHSASRDTQDTIAAGIGSFPCLCVPTWCNDHIPALKRI